MPEYIHRRIFIDKSNADSENLNVILKEGGINTIAQIHVGAGGVSTFSGNGETDTFTIPHGLNITPTIIHVTPGSQDAMGNRYITADNEEITIHYPVAPPGEGSENITFYWSARIF